MTDYNPLELLVCVGSRILEDNSTVFVGTGVPMAATMLAQKLHCPNVIPIFEAGAISPLLPGLPISVGDSRTSHQAITASTMNDVMESCQRGMVDYTFLGGAQIDMYGNLNSTMIGDDYQSPKVRFPGSGGANDLASICWKTIVITPMDARRFVPEVNFITTPGFLSGKGAREAAGLPEGTGPYKVITNLCTLGYDEETCRMRIESLHPGVSVEKVKENCGFELLQADNLDATPPPSEEELRILRDEVDPDGYIIGR
ncbi:MAG: 3-oxoacid CoA-transferase [Candidatus Anoxymicrobium japonicum]|uniref:3-oxoacid CoA-transferase n=1 Tax=Candidatus Anoxymicrobium japonicum TaxID=2013648 RepID=A0A2N3G460_9ACTN|nr:MAG: 3-oxoacid CoA-transferase [Candidatus Anoxymicrobium japonicum]